MNTSEYQMAVAKFQPRKNFKSKDDMISHAVLGLNSKAGEIAGIFQKKYQGHTIDTEHVMKEIGDALWFVSELCDALECTIEDVMKMNVEKLAKRYPEGFSEERSLNRKPGDI